MAVTPNETERPLWSLLLDREITRRKIYHQVVDPRGILAFSSRYVTECVEYLANEAVEEYKLVLSPRRQQLEREFYFIVKRSEQWQNSTARF